MIRRFFCLSSLLWVAIIPVEWGTRRDARKPWDGGQGRGGGGSPCTGSAPRLPPPLQLPTQQTSTRQFIRRGALRGEKWKKQNRKRWREAGESENYIIGRRTTNRKRKRAALTPPPQQQQPGAAIYFSLTARESPSGFWFRALTSASLQLPITAPSWRSKLTAGTPEWICDSKVWFNSLASLFTATALIIAAVLMLRSQGSDNGA